MNFTLKPGDDIEINENIRAYFTFVDVVTSDINYTLSGNRLIMTGISLAPRTEKTIVYKLKTPKPEDPIHENIDKYISFKNLIYASFGTTSWEENSVKNIFWKYRNYADIMFSAFLVADTDLNWKNFSLSL